MGQHAELLPQAVGHPDVGGRDSDGYLVFFGRIHPEKGTADAIEVARRPLAIAGIIQDQHHFDEPFGLSMIEAMACGVPVIAIGRGSVRGIVSDRGAAAAAVERIGALDRVAVRKRVEVARIRRPPR